MEHAPTTLTDAPANGVTGGLDWTRDDHAVAVVDTAGRQIKRFGVAHSDAGLRELIAGLASAGVAEIAIERPDGPVVDALLAAGLTVVVISPNQFKNLRGRYGSAGNKDDRFDPYVLADTLRTDRAQLRPLTPDTPATIALRATCRARKDLVEHRVGLTNQLRAHLHRVYPGAVAVRRAGQPDQPAVPAPLRLPGPRRLALPQAAGRLAAQRRLQRPHPARGAAYPAEHRAARSDR